MIKKVLIITTILLFAISVIPISVNAGFLDNLKKGLKIQPKKEAIPSFKVFVSGFLGKGYAKNGKMEYLPYKWLTKLNNIRFSANLNSRDRKSSAKPIYSKQSEKVSLYYVNRSDSAIHHVEKIYMYFYEDKLYQVVYSFEETCEKLLQLKSVSKTNNKSFGALLRILGPGIKGTGDLIREWETADVYSSLHRSSEDRVRSTLMVFYNPIRKLLLQEYKQKVALAKQKAQETKKQPTKEAIPNFDPLLDGFLSRDHKDLLFPNRWGTELKDIASPERLNRLNKRERKRYAAPVYSKHSEKVSLYNSGRFYNYLRVRAFLYFYENKLYQVMYNLSDWPAEVYTQRTIDKELNKATKTLLEKLGPGVEGTEGWKDFYRIWETEDFFVGLIDARHYGDAGSKLMIIRQPVLKKLMAKYDEHIKKKKENQAKLDKKLRAKAKQISLKVKGLYLGMFLNDAITIYEQKLNKPGDSYKIRKIGNEWMYGYTDAVVFIQADSNKIVNLISLDQNTHFNAGDISTKAFVKLFSKRYKKSFRYKPVFYEGLTFDYYLHENPSYTISIGQGSITLKRKASLKKVKFD
ncbi:MAG: hypothetical protein JRD05_01665 [Deltaproteobacteria bacterium]|nr:hypothetical protein [Deltaproteobacteria bacterium]